MIDLTDKWKKGQLEGFRWYYVKFKTGEIDICWLTEWSNDELGTGGQYFDGIKQENILEVLAPVPSYDDWQASEKYNKHLEEVIKIYERKEKQHTNDSIAYNEVVEELEKVKKQLAIAVEWLKEHAEDKDCWEDIREECKLILKQIRS